MNQMMNNNPIQQPLRINLDDCDNLVCPYCKKKKIEVKNFIPVVEIKIIPGTLSPTGKKQYLPITYYKCGKCKSLIKSDENLPITTIGK